MKKYKKNDTLIQTHSIYFLLIYQKIKEKKKEKKNVDLNSQKAFIDASLVKLALLLGQGNMDHHLLNPLLYLMLRNFVYLVFRTVNGKQTKPYVYFISMV